MAEIFDIVGSALRIRGVSEDVVRQELSNALRRSILRLERQGVLPPKTWQFVIEDVKEEYAVDDDVQYNYIKTPVDFRQLESLYIKGLTYNWHNNLFGMLAITSPDRNYFTITQVNFDEDKPRNIIVFNPIPDGTLVGHLKYWRDGSETSLAEIEPVYYEAVVADVLDIFGITTGSTADTIADAALINKAQGGKSGFNGGLKRTPSYFGKH